MSVRFGAEKFHFQALRQPWAYHWALGEYSIISEEEDMCIKCLINSNVLLKCNLFLCVAETFPFPGPLIISGDAENSLSFLFASLASFPYQQAPLKDLGFCCRVAIRNIF